MLVPPSQHCRNPLKELTLFVRSNSEWVASPDPSNIGAKMSKVWVGQEKPDNNAHISTVNIAVLPSLSDAISLSSSPVYSESNIHPSSESTTLDLRSSSIKSIYPVLQKTNIALTSHFIFADLNVRNNAVGSDRVLSLHLKEFFEWNQFQFGCVFQDNKSRVLGTRASFCNWCECNHEVQGPCSVVRNVLRGPWIRNKEAFKKKICNCFVPLGVLVFP